MKQPKKLTRAQKIKMEKQGVDCNDYMLLTEDNNTFTVISKKENKNIPTGIPKTHIVLIALNTVPNFSILS